MRFSALRIVQPSGRVVYSFATTADILLQLTDVPHIGRTQDEARNLVGYQRPEVASHIAEIRRYLESDDAVLPNTIVVAFADEVIFHPSAIASDHTGQLGELEIPIPDKGAPRPGFVVDGQQRFAAIASSRHERFPFFVTAMIATSLAEQRKQFVLVNRTKPLPQGMIYELLPEIEGILPQALARQQLATKLASYLNLSTTSPLHKRVRTPTCSEGNIKDNSLRKAILNSLGDGALFEVTRSHRSDPGYYDLLVQTLEIYWRGVAETFPDAWEKGPKESRLTHGVGIVALGFVMDELYLRRADNTAWTLDTVKRGLALIQNHCAWTEGVWELGDGKTRQWNEFQNLDRDVRLLSAYLRRLINQSALAL